MIVTVTVPLTILLVVLITDVDAWTTMTVMAVMESVTLKMILTVHVLTVTTQTLSASQDVLLTLTAP